MSAITRKFAKFRAWSLSEKRMLLAALLLLPAFRIGLDVLGFNRISAWLGHALASAEPAPTHDSLAAIGALVNSAASQVLGPGNCLTRSLYLQWLLRRRGVHSELRIGVQLPHGQLEAHAWVEVAGRPINDGPDVAERFAAFDLPVPAELFSTP